MEIWSLFIIVVGLVRLNLWVAETNCCSLVDDRLGGVELVIGGTDRWLLTNPLIWRRCWTFVDVDTEVGESPVIQTIEGKFSLIRLYSKMMEKTKFNKENKRFFSDQSLVY